MKQHAVFRSPRTSKAMGFAALLIALSLTISSAVASAQGGLTIKIDGYDTEWNVSGWVCPGKYPCQVPTAKNTAWLCCNTTGTPRECQLVWNDDDEAHLRYVRFYLNQTGLYAYVLTSYQHVRSRVNITLTVRGYTLNITIGTGFNSSRYKLFSGGRLIASGNLSSPGNFVFNDTQPGWRDRGIEVAFMFSTIGAHFTPQPTDEYALKVVIMWGDNVSDMSDVCKDGACTDAVRLVVRGYKIYGSYYVVGDQRYPVPVPEPGVLISAVVLATALCAVALATRRMF